VAGGAAKRSPSRRGFTIIRPQLPLYSISITILLTLIAGILFPESSVNGQSARPWADGIEGLQPGASSVVFWWMMQWDDVRSIQGLTAERSEKRAKRRSRFMSLPTHHGFLLALFVSFGCSPEANRRIPERGRVPGIRETSGLAHRPPSTIDLQRFPARRPPSVD